MSAARRFILLVVTSSVAVSLCATTVLAQGGVPNPSGGTRPACAVGPAPANTLASFLAAGTLRGWLVSEVAWRRFASPISRTAADRSLALRQVLGR